MVAESLKGKFDAESEVWLSEGGVIEPVVGAVPWLSSLEESVEVSVRKLALDRLRNSLRNEGAMAGFAAMAV